MIAYKVLSLSTGKTTTKFFRETMNRAAIISILTDSGYRVVSTEAVF